MRRRRTSANRRTLRQKKIHSLKRQIQIKEKMLEVRKEGRSDFERNFIL